MIGVASALCYPHHIMTLADRPAVQQLSREEQLELVADLWDHIATQPDDDLLAVSSEEAALLDQRLAAHEVAPESALSLEEFKRRLAAKKIVERSPCNRQNLERAVSISAWLIE